MIKTITIGFSEQAKAVVAEVKIVTEESQQNNEELLKEAQALFEEASKYSRFKTNQKVIG